jgi:ATP-binding cassette, subfamily F, member 3
LNYGHRYGLVGRNGSGKSTLMRHIASREIPIPSNLSILHVEQEVVGDDMTAIDAVLSADSELMALRKEEERLLNSGTPSAYVLYSTSTVQSD